MISTRRNHPPRLLALPRIIGIEIAFTRATIAGIAFAAMIGLPQFTSGKYSRAAAAEYHVSTVGDDNARGTASDPFRTIQHAADLAQPGDVVTVHEGVYHERINPPRGGVSDAKRITYRAAPGEKVEIKGSEIVKNWVKVQEGVWKATLPNSFFGGFNPYADLIHGDWFDPQGRKHHTGAVYIDSRWLSEAASLENVLKPSETDPLWFGQVDEKNTTLWAQFNNIDPNKQLVEINVRRTVFYPNKPGVNYITVRGFRMRHAATPWAPPTAEQIGLIGTHWSKGWIIENNIISHSRCSGITLGKYGDEWDNKAESAEGYTGTIQRALKNGWNRETIGHHVVRNNIISDCEQTGICGSLGAVFSRITGNHIHRIWHKRQFQGAEMAGIKIHAAVDMMIDNNRIHDCGRGLWLDWMAQGTRVSANLFYNNTTDDMLSEVNHGPYLVDNNIFLSPTNLLDVSQGGAFVHNLFAGKIISQPDMRTTPFHKPHSTELAGAADIKGGDNRFFNNIFIGIGKTPTVDTSTWGKSRHTVGYGLWVYDNRELPLQTGGNAYFHGAKPYRSESKRDVQPAPVCADPKVEIDEEGSNVHLRFFSPKSLPNVDTTLVNTKLLGKAKVADLPYENADGSSATVNRDYFGKPRDAKKPSPGPFEGLTGGEMKIEVWNSKAKQ